MSKSRFKNDKTSLLATGILLAIRHNNYAEAMIYMENLLKYFTLDESYYEILLLLDQVKDDPKLLNCINLEYRILLLQHAISHCNRKLINFLCKDNLLSNISTNNFCSILANILKFELYDFAEAAIHVRKKTNEMMCFNEINKTFILTQLNDNPSRIASLNFLYEHGASPMTKCHFFGTIYIPFLTAIDARDDQLITVYLSKPYLKQYKDEELIIIFKELINTGYFKQAECLLLEKYQSITKNLNQKTLDELIYLVAANTSNTQSLEKRTLMTLLIEMGANPVTQLRKTEQLASQIYPSIDWFYLIGKNIDKYTASDLVFAVCDSILGSCKYKLEFVKYILTEKQILLSQYYHDHPEELDYLLYISIGEKDDALTRLLFNMGANALKTYQPNITAFDIALNKKYYNGVKEILEPQMQNLSPKQLATAFEIASDNRWIDLTILIASNKNIKRAATINSLKCENVDEFVHLILNDTPPDTELILHLCTLNEINPDSKNMNPSLLDYAIHHHEYSMLTNIILYHYRQLSLHRMAEIITFLFDEKDNPDAIINIEYMKYLNFAKATDNLKREVAIPIFLKTIQKANTILDVMMVIETLKKNSTSFEYLHNSVFKDGLNIIFASASSRINTIAKNENEIVFDNLQQLNNVRSFLNSRTKLNFFSNADEHFMKLINGKIKYKKQGRQTPFLAA